MAPRAFCTTEPRTLAPPLPLVVLTVAQLTNARSRSTDRRRFKPRTGLRSLAAPSSSLDCHWPLLVPPRMRRRGDQALIPLDVRKGGGAIGEGGCLYHVTPCCIYDFISGTWGCVGWSLGGETWGLARSEVDSVSVVVYCIQSHSLTQEFLKASFALGKH